MRYLSIIVLAAVPLLSGCRRPQPAEWALGLFLANRGKLPWNGETVIPANQAKYINSLMLTCGTYDSVGDFAYRVGLPGKSGVGGGILAVMPGRFTAAVWSPGLDASGNSLAGTLALEWLTTKTGLSIF